jgi:hypothetical protein
MKKTILIISATVLLLSACTSVKFETSQPKGVPELTEFPKEVLGNYTDAEKDTLIIAKSTYKVGSKKSSFYSTDTLSSGKITLKKYNDYYVLSRKDENAWEIVTFKSMGDNLTVYYINYNSENEKEIIEKLRKIVTVKEVKNTEGKIDYYLINPTKEEFDALMNKQLFSKIVCFKRIK